MITCIYRNEEKDKKLYGSKVALFYQNYVNISLKLNLPKVYCDKLKVYVVILTATLFLKNSFKYIFLKIHTTEDLSMIKIMSSYGAKETSACSPL